MTGHTRTGRSYQARRTLPGVGGTQVVAWTVFGGGHTWPGSAAVPGSAEMTTQEFDAAEEICRFAEPLLASAATRRIPLGGAAAAWVR
jgi:polyhydroxybutyrate depolymerase